MQVRPCRKFFSAGACENGVCELSHDFFGVRVANLPPGTEAKSLGQFFSFAQPVAAWLIDSACGVVLFADEASADLAIAWMSVSTAKVLPMPKRTVNAESMRNVAASIIVDRARTCVLLVPDSGDVGPIEDEFSNDTKIWNLCKHPQTNAQSVLEGNDQFHTIVGEPKSFFLLQTQALDKSDLLVIYKFGDVMLERKSELTFFLKRMHMHDGFSIVLLTIGEWLDEAHSLFGRKFEVWKHARSAFHLLVSSSEEFLRRRLQILEFFNERDEGRAEAESERKRSRTSEQQKEETEKADSRRRIVYRDLFSVLRDVVFHEVPRKAAEVVVICRTNAEVDSIKDYLTGVVNRRMLPVTVASTKRPTPESIVSRSEVIVSTIGRMETMQKGRFISLMNSKLVCLFACEKLFSLDVNLVLKIKRLLSEVPKDSIVLMEEDCELQRTKESCSWHKSMTLVDLERRFVVLSSHARLLQHLAPRANVRDDQLVSEKSIVETVIPIQTAPSGSWVEELQDLLARLPEDFEGFLLDSIQHLVSLPSDKMPKEAILGSDSDLMLICRKAEFVSLRSAAWRSRQPRDHFLQDTVLFIRSFFIGTCKEVLTDLINSALGQDVLRDVQLVGNELWILRFASADLAWRALNLRLEIGGRVLQIFGAASTVGLNHASWENVVDKVAWVDFPPSLPYDEIMSIVSDCGPVISSCLIHREKDKICLVQFAKAESVFACVCCAKKNKANYFRYLAWVKKK